MAHFNAAKGLAILLIVFFHICGQIFSGEPIWFRRFSYQGVNVFFFLSGLGLSCSFLKGAPSVRGGRYWAGWFAKRFLRIVPMYWFVLLLTLLLYLSDTGMVRISINSEKVDPLLDFVAHFFMVHIYSSKTFYSINVAWWFLAVIVHLYAVFPVLMNLAVRKHTNIAVYVLLPALVVLNMQYGFMKIQVLMAFIVFTLGICVATLDIDRLHNCIRRQSSVLLMVLMGLLALAYRFLDAGPMQLRGYAYVFFSLFSTALLYVLSVKIAYLASEARQPGYSLKMVFLRLAKVTNVSLGVAGSRAYALFLVHWGLIYPVVRSFRNVYAGILVYLLAVFLLALCLTWADKKIHSVLLHRVVPLFRES